MAAVMDAPDAKNTIKGRKPKLGVIRGVEIFTTGTHKDSDYTTSDLDDIVSNFDRWGPDGDEDVTVDPPCVIGHEEDQSLLNNTGIPSVGRVGRLWREGPTLKADLVDVPLSIAKLINGRAYHKVSPEIYETAPEGVPAKGKMLRRLAFLGGELPHIKDLADLPLADYETFSEPYMLSTQTIYRLLCTETRRDGGSVRFFSEVLKMDRDEMIKKAIEKGMSREVAEGMDDKQLQAAIGEESNAAKEGDVPGEGEKKDSDTSWMDSKDKKEFMEGFKGHLTKHLEGCRKKYTEAFGEDMPVDYQDTDLDDDDEDEDDEGDEDEGDDDDEEGDEDTGEGEGDDDETKEFSDETVPDNAGTANNDKTMIGDKERDSAPVQFSESAIAKIVQAEIAKAMAPVRNDIKRFSEAGRQSKRHEVEAFLDRMVESGRVSPQERDREGGIITLDEKLMLADNTTKIGKYRESLTGKKEPMTQYKAMCEEIRHRPAEYHGERIAINDAAGEIKYFYEGDLDVVKVQRFSESPEGRKTLKAIGDTPETFMSTYKAAGKEDRARLLSDLKNSGAAI